jgi:hypothetical protein
VVGLSCIAAFFHLTRHDAATVESPEVDVFADDDFEASSTDRAIATHGNRSRVSAGANAVGDGELPLGSAMQAVYHTTDKLAVRTVWFDGTIIPDDSHEH